MIKKILIVLLVLILVTPFLLISIGNVSTPKMNQQPLTEQEIKEKSKFLPKEQWGVNQVVLSGNSFERGQEFGYWTRDLLFKQEKALISKLDEVLPSKLTQYAIFFFSMGWFYGLDEYYKDYWQEEMYGVSLHGSKENLYFASPYTRQLAYHGIHDMGQMMIDHGFVLGACTQILKRQNQGWLIGRNFDFEAGKVFDEDKVLKWVFPEKGYAFVSIIFSGMVGVITGINEHGVYVAINAAGSDDFTRLGTPTTLIALEALQNSKTAEEAVEIIKKSTPLITDIFVVADKETKSFIVEKTPERFQVTANEDSYPVTNHLQHPAWKEDSTNQSRMENNTTLSRFKRAKALIPEIQGAGSMVRALRDKVQIDGKPVYTHRASIDAMIASHSVVYDSSKMHLYVSKGPSLSQAYVGIDLEKSFSQKSPVTLPSIQPDPDFKIQNFHDLKMQVKTISMARKLAQASRCQEAEQKIQSINNRNFTNSYFFSWTLAEIAECQGQDDKAHNLYSLALSQQPAYKREIDHLKKKVNQEPKK